MSSPTPAPGIVMLVKPGLAFVDDGGVLGSSPPPVVEPNELAGGWLGLGCLDGVPARSEGCLKLESCGVIGHKGTIACKDGVLREKVVPMDPEPELPSVCESRLGPYLGPGNTKLGCKLLKPPLSNMGISSGSKSQSPAFSSYFLEPSQYAKKSAM
mmetsp:Transcript_54482/g.100767  ORF Transcript_54482/g.100767 Transcript_54482/m.100767 type:complete len:156 (+) Transcript_54482:1256-1723(+)